MGASSLSERFQHALDSTDASHHPELFDEYHYQVGMIIREEKLGHLPFYTHLWVDEAHLFEQGISNALSDQVSLWALLNKTRDVMGESFVKRHALKEKFEKIKALAVEDTIEIGDATEAQLSLRTLLLGFLDALASSRSKDKHKRALRDEARNLVDKLNELRQPISGCKRGDGPVSPLELSSLPDNDTHRKALGDATRQCCQEHVGIAH